MARTKVDRWQFFFVKARIGETSTTGEVAFSWAGCVSVTNNSLEFFPFCQGPKDQGRRTLADAACRAPKLESKQKRVRARLGTRRVAARVRHHAVEHRVTSRAAKPEVAGCFTLKLDIGRIGIVNTSKTTRPQKPRGEASHARPIEVHSCYIGPPPRITSRSYRSPISLTNFPICDRETSSRAWLGDCVLHGNCLYRLLLNPLPQPFEVCLAHRLHRA